MRHLAALLVVSILYGSSAAQSTLLVPEQYATLQDAVDAASDGDTVSVAPGTYRGSTRVIDKNVHLVSRDGPQTTILDGAGAQVLHVDNGVGVTSIVRGFTLQNGSADFGGGAEVYYSSPYIVNCVFRANSAQYGGGLEIQGGAATVVNCLFKENFAYESGAAIMGGWATAGVLVSNCTVVENVLNTGPLQTAAFVWFNAGNATFANGIIYHNDTPNDADSSITGGTVLNSNIELWPPPGAISEDPMFVAPRLADFRLQLGSPSRDTGSGANLPPDAADLDGDGNVTEPLPLDLDGNPRSLDTAVDMGCYEADAGPVRYCTAKTNSCGSLPAIEFTGHPSATSSSGFTVAARNTPAGKLGLLIYSDAGQAALPFAGGTLCVASPRHRSVQLIDTTGTPGLCDGVLSIDLNTFAAGGLGGHPSAFLLVPGTRVDVQFWGRDIPGSVMLSNALEYWVNP